MTILCIGGSAYDVTLPIKGYPEENKKYRINKRVSCGGGSANNASYLLSLWENKNVYLASCVGNDLHGQMIIDEQKKVGVKTDFMEVLPLPTTTSYIINNLTNGTRTIITNKHDEMKFTKIHDIPVKPDVILVDGNDYEMSLKVLKDNQQAIKIIDAGSLKEGMKQLCELCDYIVCSNDFAKDYTKVNFAYDDMNMIQKAYDKLDEDFSGQVIITLEKEGSFTKVDGKYFLIPSISVSSVDSTGAGDIYHGAFTHFIAHGYPLIEAIKYSNIAGALSVKQIGSKNSMPSLREVMNYHAL